MRDLGVIDWRRGHIKVLDRGTLEELSCECYAVVKAESDVLLPYSCLMHPRDGSVRVPARPGFSVPQPGASLRSAV